MTPTPLIAHAEGGAVLTDDQIAHYTKAHNYVAPAPVKKMAREIQAFRAALPKEAERQREVSGDAIKAVAKALEEIDMAGDDNPELFPAGTYWETLARAAIAALPAVSKPLEGNASELRKLLAECNAGSEVIMREGDRAVFIQQEVAIEAMRRLQPSGAEGVRGDERNDFKDIEAEVQDVLTWAHNVSMDCEGRIPTEDSVGIPVNSFYLRCISNAVDKLRAAKSDRVKRWMKEAQSGQPSIPRSADAEWEQVKYTDGSYSRECIEKPAKQQAAPDGEFGDWLIISWRNDMDGAYGNLLETFEGTAEGAELAALKYVDEYSPVGVCREIAAMTSATGGRDE